MSIAKQQMELTMQAKRLFADTYIAWVKAHPEQPIEQSVGEGVRAASVEVDREFGTAIAFFLTHDFVAHMNKIPGNPVHVDISGYGHGDDSFDAGVLLN